MRFKEWIYNAGMFSYGQRIEVGQVFDNDELSAYEKMKQAWRVLYGWNGRLMPPRLRVKMFNRMLDGLKYWADLEKAELHYTPTAEEERAGLARLNSEVGAMGTVNALAQKFGKDPDEILRWEWAKVFGILRTDLKEYLYNRRLSEQYTKKM